MVELQDKSKASIHEWFNSVGVIFASAIAIFSAYYARQTALLKEENIGITSIPSGACNVEYYKSGDDGTLGLCWDVTISNKSDLKIALVNYRVSELVDQGRIMVGGFHEIMTMEGAPQSMPIILDGGEARQIVVRAPVQVPASVAQVIAGMEKSGFSLPTITLAPLQNRLAETRMDFLGDPIDVMLDNGNIQGWSLKPPFRSAITMLEMQTGRGQWFLGDMVWPPIPES